MPKQTHAARAKTAGLFALLCLPGLLPLVAWPLPFQDSLGHVGVIGALRWMVVDPSMLGADLEFRGWLGPNRLFYVLPTVLGLALGGDGGARLGYALTLALVAPLVAGGLRVSGRDWRWALLFVPLVLGRVLACGFVPNVLALGFLGLLLGFVSSLVSSRRRLLGLGLGGGGTLLSHSFVGLAGCGFLFLGSLADLAARAWRSAAYKAALSVGLIVFGLGLLGSPSSGGGSSIEAIWAAVSWPDPSRWSRALEWSMAWAGGVRWDDYLQYAWLFFAALGVAANRGGARPRLALWMALTSSLVVMLCVDENIGPPVSWWGGWLRVPTMVALLLVFLAAPDPRRGSGLLGRAALGGGAAVSVVYSAAVIVFVAGAARAEYRGLDEVLEAAPPRRQVCSMWFGDESRVKGLPGAAHWYVGNHYLLNRGGRVAHGLFGNQGAPVYRPKTLVHQPGWGQGWGFHPSRHFEGCELFLVRVDPGNPERPFSGALRSRVELLESSGLWRLWAPVEGVEP